MNFNNLPKKRRGVYEKEFTLQHVLQNLQGYRLATGAVDQQQLNESRQRHGNDEGRVYGALISGATNLPAGPTPTSEHSEDIAYRKRRRKRRKNRKTSAIPPTSDSSSRLTSTTHSKSLSKDKLPSTDGTASLQGEGVAGSLGLLHAYGDSDSTDSESDQDRLGAQVRKKLAIPSAIQDMFQEKQPKHLEKEEQFSFATDSSRLGFFGEDDSVSVEDEVRSKHEIVSSDAIPQGSSHSVSKKWNEEKGQWIFGESDLSSYTCWKCSNVGHLAKDCTVSVTHGQGAGRAGAEVKVPKGLRALYATCREVKSKRGQRCAECGVHSNLACCLDCRSVVCDGRGHLVSHLLDHPSHNILFSFKLGRLLKCCQPRCEVVSVYELLVCSYCLGKAFSQHYSMINAIWSSAGLRKISNALCCEEHFQWHRMNCPNVCEESFITEQKLHLHNNSNGLLSEFYF